MGKVIQSPKQRAPGNHTNGPWSNKICTKFSQFPFQVMTSVDKRLQSIQDELRLERQQLRKRQDEAGKISTELKQVSAWLYNVIAKETSQTIGICLFQCSHLPVPVFISRHT